MKKITLIAAALLSSLGLYAQAWGEGSKVVSVGYGAPNLGKSILKIYENETGFDVSGFGPLHAKFEYGVSEKIGLGLSFNMVNFGASWREEFLGFETYTYNVDVTGWSVLARMNLHFATGDKIDPYWGFGLGYRSTTWTFTSDDPLFINTSFPTFPFGFETTIGMRYYFIPNIGIYAEAGIAKSLIQAGVVAKF